MIKAKKKGENRKMKMDKEKTNKTMKRKKLCIVNGYEKRNKSQKKTFPRNKYTYTLTNTQRKKEKKVKQNQQISK